MPDKWQRIIDSLEISRRDFILSTVAAGTLTLTPRFVAAQAARPYKIGVLLPSTGTGANYMAHCIKGLPLAVAELNKRGLSRRIDTVGQDALDEGIVTAGATADRRFIAGTLIELGLSDGTDLDGLLPPPTVRRLRMRAARRSPEGV